MSRHFVAAAVAVGMSIGLSVPAVAGSYAQLASAVGVGAEADTLSLDQIAALKFSMEADDSEQALAARSTGRPMVRSSRTGAEPGLDPAHLRLINAGVSGDERQPELQRETAAADPAARGQLATGGRISAAEAAGLTLSAVAKAKFEREPDE